MSERASNNSMLYFLVGALAVAVLGIGFVILGTGGDEAGGAARATVEDSGTDIKLELGKNGKLSGSIEKK